MSVVGFILYVIGVYLLVGLVVGLFFVLGGVRGVDPVAAAAPVRVRMLFLPGSVAVWPIVVWRWRMLKDGGGQHGS